MAFQTGFCPLYQQTNKQLFVYVQYTAKPNLAPQPLMKHQSHSDAQTSYILAKINL